jgi:hypothetical protein
MKFSDVPPYARHNKVIFFEVFGVRKILGPDFFGPFMGYDLRPWTVMRLTTAVGIFLEIWRRQFFENDYKG